MKRFMLILIAAVCGACSVSADPRMGVTVVATDYPSLQAAVDALSNRTGTVYLPAGAYVLTNTLDLTRPPSADDGSGLVLAGAGTATRIVARTRGLPAVDLTGAFHCTLRDLTLASGACLVSDGDAPNVGILLARQTDEAALQEHAFVNVNLEGACTVANVYNVGSDNSRFIGCRFDNSAPGAHNLVWSSENFAGVASPCRGTIADVSGAAELRVIGCTFRHSGGGSRASNLRLAGSVYQSTVRDCELQAPAGGYAVYLGASSSTPVCSTELYGLLIRAEEAAHALRVQGRAERLTVACSTIVYGEGTALMGDAVRFLAFKNNEVRNVRGWKTALRVQALYDSRIADCRYVFDNEGGTNPQAGPACVARGSLAARSYVEVGGRDQFDYETVRATLVAARDDPGGRRADLGSADSGVVLNLKPVDTGSLTGMIRGDMALDDGTGTTSGEPGLAVFNGTNWVYMN